MVNIVIISIGLASKANKLELKYTYKYLYTFFFCFIFTGWYQKYCLDNETQSFVLMVMGLALLPPQGVAQGLVWLRQLAKSQPAAELLNYYENTWVQKWKPDQVSLFKRRIRTNNDLEGMYFLPCKVIVRNYKYVTLYTVLGLFVVDDCMLI